MSYKDFEKSYRKHFYNQVNNCDDKCGCKFDIKSGEKIEKDKFEVITESKNLNISLEKEKKEQKDISAVVISDKVENKGIETKKAKNEKRGLKLSFFRSRISFVFFGIMLVALVMLFVTTVISVKNASTEKIGDFRSNTVYAVVSAPFDNTNTAKLMSTNIKSRGGAGTIIYDNGKFHVCYFAYPKKDQAESVSQKLKNGGVYVELYDITLKSYSIPLSENNNGSLVESVQFLNSLYDSCYSVIIDFDGGKTSFEKTKENVEKLKNNVDTLLRKLKKNSFFGDKIYVELSKIKNGLEDALLKSEKEFSQCLKSAAINFLMSYKEAVESF